MAAEHAARPGAGRLAVGDDGLARDPDLFDAGREFGRPVEACEVGEIGGEEDEIGGKPGADEATMASRPILPIAIPADPGTATEAAASMDARM